MRYLIAILFLGISSISFSQFEEEKNKIIESRIEFIGESLEDSDFDFTTFLEDLYFFYDYPLDLNRATFEDYLKLHLLTDIQIYSIINYKMKFGDYISIYELSAVENLDLRTIEMIIPFVTISGKEPEKIKMKNAFKYGKNEVIVRYQRDLQTKEGYIPKSDSILALNPNKQYLGSPDKIYFRYRFTYKDKISWGITGEKDAGEQFFGETQPYGFDFYSGHVMINDLGIIKRVIIGDYHANLGQGLTLWTGFNIGKTPNVMNIKRNGGGIRPYTSVNEANFLRGAAIMFEKGKFDFTTLVSYKKLDANVNFDQNDSLLTDEGIISSFQISGFHRTPSELAKKNTVTQTILGGALNFKHNNFKIGIVGAYFDYDIALGESSSTYSKFNFNGNNLLSGGINYSYYYRKTSFFGEATTSDRGGVNVMNGMTWHAHPKIDLAIVHRLLDRRMQTIYSAPFGGSLTNEHGLYFGIYAKINAKLNISAYYDQFKQNWLSYLTDGPSFGREILIQADYRINRNSSFYIRYKNKITQRNGRDVYFGAKEQIFQNRTNLRFHYQQRINDQISIRSRIEVVQFLFDKDKSNGILLYQDLIYQFKKVPLKLSFRYAIFDTDNYDTRIYAYENDLLYLFSIPSYFYKGIRTYALAKYSITDKIDFWIRWGMYSYENIDQISSGLETIYGNKKSDIRIQLKIKI